MTLLPYDRWDGGVGAPGTWHGGRKSDGKRIASVCCPKCKKIAMLSDHEIKPGGIVAPSVVCPREGCTWHVFVQLDGWNSVCKD